MFNRIVGVLKLDKNTFEQIEHAADATMQALIIVLVVSLLTGLGQGSASRHGFFTGFLGNLVWTFVAWLLWAAVAYFVGSSLFGGKGSMMGMLRVVGFAYAPMILSIIPCVGAIVGLIWSLVAMFVAVRQGLELDDLKTVLTIIIGWGIYVVGTILIRFII